MKVKLFRFILKDFCKHVIITSLIICNDYAVDKNNPSNKQYYYLILSQIMLKGMTNTKAREIISLNKELVL